ncbi:hypothetical protein [Candidatus Nitrospira bockiana]
MSVPTVIAAVVAVLASSSAAAGEVLIVECHGQVNFTARVDLSEKTVTYLNSEKSYPLTRLDETYLEWAEHDDYGHSTNSLHRRTGYYTETFTHWKDGRRDVTKAVCKPVQEPRP